MRAKFSELSYTGAAPKCCAQAGGEKEPWLTAEQIPECKWKDRGLAPTGLLAGLEHGEEVVALLPRSGAGESLLFVTARGLVKRTLSSEYGARKGSPRHKILSSLYAVQSAKEKSLCIPSTNV